MAGKASSASAANSSSRATTSSPRSSTDQARPSSIEQKRKPTEVDTKEASASAAHKPQHDATSHELNAAGSNGVVCSTSESPDDVLRAGTIEAGPAAGHEPKENTTTIRPDVNGESEASQDQHGSQTASGEEVRLPRSEQDPSEVLANVDNQQNQQQSELIKELQALSDRQQQEIQDYVERVDSLESKLQYLSRTATEAAKKAASSAPSGSAEQKLAEKDEKIALLMEEGQKLSSNEHKLRATTKKLRALLGENEKQIADLKTKRDKAISDAEALRSRLDGSEETSRATAALRREIDALKRENAKKDDAHRRLDQEWTKKMDQAEASHRDALNKALAAERQKQKTLEEANASLAAEKEAVAEQARQDEIEWREKLERAHERARKTETELKTELLATEGKLEAMRVAAEEASSGSGGDAQVKMFRQMETLQSQYAAARQNWQGIEASLLAKLAGLEKERDEAQSRESEMRRKARDAVSLLVLFKGFSRSF